MINITLFLFGALFCVSESIYIVNPGAKYPPTKGEVWPKPQHEVKTQSFYTFNPSSFQFKIKGETCSILEDALDRCIYRLAHYNSIIRNIQKKGRKGRQRGLLCAPKDLEQIDDDNYQGPLHELDITLTQPCEEYPYLEMNESYNLTISASSGLMSSSIWGILLGLETFSQLFYLSDNYNEVRINSTQIEDYPRYPHRGLLLDTARHYISVPNILLTLDAMSYNKFNVFHWHITDDQSFPYESTKFPELSANGAFHFSAVYTKQDIQKIINYARCRGIRVIPEFDVPGHTRSWGAAFPYVLTKCYKDRNVVGLGPMDPTKNTTYKLIRDLFEEVNDLFPDKYFHVGGDEVDLSCWLSNENIKEFMKERKMSSVDELHAYFMENTLPLLSPGTKTIVWQEVFDNKVTMPKDTLVQVWKYGPVEEMKKLLNAGYKVLFSSSYYLDQKKTLGSWEELYKDDPRQMLQNQSLEKNIMGGEACMWGEMVDDQNVIDRIWPRASAVAERLWSSKVGTMEQAKPRLEEHTCRLIRRGIHAPPPDGPSFCLA